MKDYQTIRTYHQPDGGETFFIAAPDGYPAAFEKALRDKEIGFKRVVGVYKGESEIAYVINARSYKELTPYIAQQESVLVLGPIGRSGVRPAALYYLDPFRLPENLGYFYSVPKDEACDCDHSYDPNADTYYVCRHHYPEFPIAK